MYACDDTRTCRMNGGANGHFKVEGEFLYTGMTEARSEALNNAKRSAGGIREGVQMIIIVVRVVNANRPVEMPVEVVYALAVEVLQHN